MNKVSIIGFGRFGNLLYELLQKGFEIDVFDIDSNNETESVHFVSLEDVLKNDTIFLAVPIRDFEELIWIDGDVDFEIEDINLSKVSNAKIQKITKKSKIRPAGNLVHFFKILK